jgi:predicted esterase
VEEIIEKEVNKGILSQNIFIIGISQCGSLALVIAMISKYQLGGFLALGSFILYPKVLKEIETEKNKQVPIFMGHGKEDKIVPYEVNLKSALIMCQKGYYVEFKDYPRIGHDPLHFTLMIIDRINPYGYGDVFRFFRSKNLPNGNVVIVEILRQNKIILD